MTTWSETKKACFKWNQYVKMFVDGEQVTDVVQVRDTAMYDEYEVDEMFGYNGMTKVMLVKPKADESNSEAETAKLHTYNECDERPVEMMVGKAMCAYANLRKVTDNEALMASSGAFTKHEVEIAKAKHSSEYEATIRCIDMFVKDGLYAIQDYVTGRAKDEFDIK